jgi:hypothetical protein
MTKSRDIDNPSGPQDNDPGGGMRSSGSGPVHGGEENRPGQSPQDEKKTDMATVTPEPTPGYSAKEN